MHGVRGYERRPRGPHRPLLLQLGHRLHVPPWARSFRALVVDLASSSVPVALVVVFVFNRCCCCQGHLREEQVFRCSVVINSSRASLVMSASACFLDQRARCYCLSCHCSASYFSPVCLPSTFSHRHPWGVSVLRKRSSPHAPSACDVPRASLAHRNNPAKKGTRRLTLTAMGTVRALLAAVGVTGRFYGALAGRMHIDSSSGPWPGRGPASFSENTVASLGSIPQRPPKDARNLRPLTGCLQHRCE